MPEFRVVILSKDPTNLIPCVQAIFANEPELPRERIVVVDDGARASADGALPGVTWLDGIKPFSFSRNANIGLLTPLNGEYQDGILLNDDAMLQTPNGFSLLSSIATQHPEYGIISAATNNVGNINQLPKNSGLREDRMVCFICVYLPLVVLSKIGCLDERFGAAYGWEDNDMCRRVRQAGLKIGVFDGCFVDHSKLHSTFRSGRHADIEANKRVYLDKWGSLD